MTVRLHIDRVVVEGVAAGEVPHLRAALERVLAERLADQAPVLMEGGNRDAACRRASVALPHGDSSGAAMGRATALALHLELLQCDD